MVVKISYPKTVRSAINYNEHKVDRGKAECLHAENFLKEHDQMRFTEKLERFEKQNELRPTVDKNTLHISLNFDKSDDLDREKLVAISRDYMERIGFSKQPYLIYEHHDAGHKHVHIVTNNIDEEGKRISTHNIGRNQSSEARKAIEQKYELTQAESKKQQQYELKPVDSRIALYGKSETKQQVQNILSEVVDKYKFTSIEQLNSVLKLYNVRADRGQENSRLRNVRGLYYRVLDEAGKAIGVPLKASIFHNKPTLKNLEIKCRENELSRNDANRRHIKLMVDWALLQKQRSIEALKIELSKHGIGMSMQQDSEGRIKGLIFIDHKSKAVHKGSEIGKEYSAAGVYERLEMKQQQDQSIQQEITRKQRRGLSR